MAEKKNQPKTAKNAKSEAAGKKNAEEKKTNIPYLYIAVAIIVVAGAFVLIKGPMIGAPVPFSTFKSTFQSASRVGIVATFSNQSQYENESPCFTSLIQVVARTRKASTIDFFIVNQANATCTYSSTGLGGAISLNTSNSAHCIGIAKSEPTLFLNYSASNSTMITASSMFIYGNSRHMASCPIEVEMN